MVTGQSDTVVIALAVLGFATSALTLIVGAYVAIKTAEVRGEVKIVKSDVASTHELVNGLTSDLRAATSAQASAEGYTAGEAAERDRAASPSTAPAGPQDVTIVNPEPVEVVDVGPAP